MTALPSGVEGAHVGSFCPETDWSEALFGIDMVVHLAARAHVMRESTVIRLPRTGRLMLRGLNALRLRPQMPALNVLSI